MKNRILLFWGIMLILASCKITQPYQRPADIIQKLSYRDTLDKQINAISNVISDTASIATLPWKQMFSDTLLQSLIQEGINNNLDLKIAVARIKVAQANLRQSKAAFFPSLTVGADATYQRTTQLSPGNSQIYDVSMSSAWEADLWGKLKSTQRAQLATLLQSYAYQKAVQTQLVASIASDYYELLAYDQQLKVTIATVKNRKEDVRVTKALKESDVLTGAAVVQSQANVFSAEVTIPDLRESIRETENAISILLAHNPGPVKRDSLYHQGTPPNLSTGFPVALLANRPDVQEAEYQYRNSAELTNVARAYFYPALTITAQGGFSNSNIAQLFNPSYLIGNVVGGISQPIFNNGLNKQRLDAAKGLQEEYGYTFRETLLSAVQEVSDALYRYKAAQNKIDIRSGQIAMLQKSVDYTRQLMRYNSSTNYTDVLTSEQSLLAAQLSGISDKLQQLQSVVTLYTSLGGGWK